MNTIKDRGHQGVSQPGAGEEQQAGVVGTVKEKASEVAEAVSDVTAQARERVEHYAAEAAEGLGRASERVSDWASDTCRRSSEVARDAGNELTTLIRRHPMPALLVGLAAGFLLSRALRS